MYCLYFSLHYLPLTDAILLGYTRPLFIPIVVFFWFQKKWTKNTWIGLLLGFIGVLLILKPDQALFNTAALVGLASGMFGGIAFTTIRRLTKTEPSDRILFYYLILSLPLSVVPLIKVWKTPEPKEWGLIVLIAAAATVYQMSLTRAYRHAKAFKVGSILYSAVIFGWIFDFFLGNKVITPISILGILLIILGSFISLKENKKE